MLEDTRSVFKARRMKKKYISVPFAETIQELFICIDIVTVFSGPSLGVLILSLSSKLGFKPASWAYKEELMRL